MRQFGILRYGDDTSGTAYDLAGIRSGVYRELVWDFDRDLLCGPSVYKTFETEDELVADMLQRIRFMADLHLEKDFQKQALFAPAYNQKVRETAIRLAARAQDSAGQSRGGLVPVLAAAGAAALLAVLKKKKETDQPASGLLIHAERDSICMGDDVMAPNAQDIRLKEDTRVSELMKWIAGYVPAMRNYEWDIWCTNKMIGKLISGEDCKYKSELLIKDITISELPDKKIFCGIKR